MEPLVGRDRRLQALLRRARKLRRRLLPERPSQRRCSLEILAGGRVGAGGEPDGQPGDDWIDARLEHRDPDRDPQPDGDGAAAERRVAQCDQSGEQRDRDAQRHERDMTGVDGRDHHQRGEIVDDRQRQQEDTDAGRGPRGHQSDGPERERGIGRHRRRPAVRAAAARVEGEVDQDRHRDAAERRHHRNREPAGALAARRGRAAAWPPDPPPGRTESSSPR